LLLLRIGWFAPFPTRRFSLLLLDRHFLGHCCCFVDSLLVVVPCL
jgi:hypothetical protein